MLAADSITKGHTANLTEPEIISARRRAVVKEQLIRYRPGRDPKPDSRTDWDRLKRMSDEEVERQRATIRTRSRSPTRNWPAASGRRR